MSDIQTNLQKILSAVWGKDVRKAIHDSIRDCYEDGKAGVLDLIARQNIEVLQNTKADKTALAQEKTERLAEVAVERSRIDNITTLPEGSTSGDAELADGRIGYDGTTYQNLGTAIRTQVKDLHDSLETANAEINTNKSNIEVLQNEVDSFEGISEDVKVALLNCFDRVMWIDDTSGQSAYDDLYNALYGQTPTIEPSYDFRKMEYDVGGGGPSDIYTWTGSTKTLTGYRLFGRNDMTNRARMRTFMPAVSGTITAMPGYEIVAYLFDSIQFASSWETNPKTATTNKFGNSGAVNFNSSYPAWVQSYTIEDSDCKYVLLCFRKTDNTDWTQTELQNMYGTVFTASLSPSYKLFDIAEYTGGYTYGEGDMVKDVAVVDGGISHKRTYVRKSAVSARAVVDYLPITKGIFRSADPTKYQICVYQIDSEGGMIWDAENPHGTGGYAIPAWADEYDLSLNPKQNEVFCVCISFKKLDGTDFTQEELSNMYGTVFTYSEGE